MTREHDRSSLHEPSSLRVLQVQDQAALGVLRFQHLQHLLLHLVWYLCQLQSIVRS